MIRYLFLVLFLLSSAVNAATYYVDCDNGNDSNDGSGTSVPKLTVGSITIGANDTIYIKSGTTCNEQISITVDGVTITNWPTDTDGERNFVTSPISFDPSGKWTIDGDNTRAYGILTTAASSVTITDGEIKNTTENGISFNLDTAATTDSNFTVTRVIVHAIGPGITITGEADYNNGTCFFARTGPSTGTAVLSTITYTDTVAYDCGKHGYDARWRVTNVTYNRALAYNNGLTGTGHGFSTHPLFAEFVGTTGWTDVDGGGAGTIYSRARTSTSDVEQRFINSTDNVILTKNTGTPTTPGTNEWGVNATTLYVNIGASLTGKTLLMKRHPHGPFIYTNSVSWGNLDGLTANEGHGFSADDLSGPAYYFGNYAYDNAGDGFKTLRGESIVWRGNISQSNDDSGFAITSCTNCEFTNNTADQNGTRGFWDGGVTSVNVDISNNIATNDATRGFSMETGTVAASGYSDVDNITFGNVNNGCTGVVNCTATDPMYAGGRVPRNREGLRLKAASTLRRDGTEQNVGNYIDGLGRAFSHPPTIGGMEAASGDEASTRTNR